MKKVILFLSIFFLSISCQKEENPTSNSPLREFICINSKANVPVTVEEVKKYIYGEWKLEGIIADIPNPKIPIVKIVFRDILGAPIDNQVADVYENDVLKFTSIYSLKQENNEVRIIAVTLPVNDYNFLSGSIRICEKELMIDSGMAFDAPAFLFRKK